MCFYHCLGTHPISELLQHYGSLRANQSPVANAGPDQNFFFPANSADLSGSGADPDGTVVSYQWAKIYGPSQFTLTAPSQAHATVSNLAVGIYKFELTVTDNAGATGKDTVTITINQATNQPPVANAGSDINITLPTNSVTLAGSGSDADGTVASYQWAKVSGPSQYHHCLTELGKNNCKQS